MSHPVANVALTDTFQTWVNKTNQLATNANEINPSANTLSANTITVGSATTSAKTSTIGPLTANSSIIQIASTAKTNVLSSNTDIGGSTLWVTANTTFEGTVKITGSTIASEDTAIVMAIALG